jgi:hypothetical protein
MDRTETDETTPDYFRRDQADGISPPDLAKDCSYAEHIVHARGKRTRYTSVSLSPDLIRDFGTTLYKLKRAQVVNDGHVLIEYNALVIALQQVAVKGDKADRERAIAALRYAKRRKEGLVEWQFNIASVPRKDIITWAMHHVQSYFVKV